MERRGTPAGFARCTVMTWLPAVDGQRFTSRRYSDSGRVDTMLDCVRRGLILVGISATLRDDPASARRADEEARVLLRTATALYASMSLDGAVQERARRGI